MDLATARSDERHASRTRHDAKPATLDRFWIHIANLVVIKRCEALNPRILVVCLRNEYCCVQESGRRRFTVRPTAKYVDECLALVQLQNGILVVRPLTRSRGVRIYATKTTARDQVQHALFRAVVGKLQ